MRKGFTIIEAMIAVTITVLLSSFVITYSSTGRQQISLSIERAKLVQVVARAKGLALNGYKEQDPTCGFGVSMDYDLHTYTLFSYRTANCDAIASIDKGSPGYKPEQVYTLVNGVEFGSDLNRLEAVLFVPPDPTTLIWNGSATSSAGIIPLRARNGSLSYGIKISQAGQINY